MSATDPTIPIPVINRRAIVAGLRDFAKFIEDNPNLPVPARPEIHLSVIRETDDDELAEVDRIAEILGVEAEYFHGPHLYHAVGSFGPVGYKVTCISDEYMEEYDRKMALIDVITETGEIAAEEWPV